MCDSEGLSPLTHRRFLRGWVGPGIWSLVACFSYIGLSLPDLYSQTYQSEPVTAGFRVFHYDAGGVNNEPTQEKPESKLWYHDGYWWGVLWDPNVGEYAFKIHRFDLATQTWMVTGLTVDDRRRSSADVLTDGEKLYIVSRAKETHKNEEGPDTALLTRYTYDVQSKSYSLDVGFPLEVSGTEKTRSLTIAKDSIGRLWVVWTAHDKVIVNRTLSDDLTWGTPFVLPVQGNKLADIDLASIIAFGDKVGILWSNQRDEKYYFAVHQDASADTVWDAREEALADTLLPKIADDHINLACKTSDGTLVAAVKTSTSGSSNPRIFVLKREPLTGIWSRHLFGVGADDHTRPVALINSDTDSVHVFARSKEVDAIVLKSAHLSDLNFPAGIGTHFIRSSADDLVNNPTSTKQMVDSTSGILVLATAKDSKFYLHNFKNLAGNGSPVAVDDNYAIDEDSTLVAAAPGIIGNDTDADGDSLISVLLSTPLMGLLTFNPDGSFNYVPQPDTSGLDQFSYLLSDGKGGTASATVYLTVNSINDVPVALNDSYICDTDSSLSVGLPGVLANDSDVEGDSLSAQLVSPPASGALIFNPDGSFVYTPFANFIGLDTFSYTIHDIHGDSSTAMVTLTVVDVNYPPTALDDTFELVEDDSLFVTSPGVLANDSDVDGDSMSVSLISGPANGSLILNSDGSFSYIPTPNFSGLDSFTYAAQDADSSASATATLNVRAVNDPPQAFDDTFSVNPDSLLSVAAPGILTNDIDDGTGALTVSLLQGTSNGTLNHNLDGSFTYIPDNGFIGNDSFAYAAVDASGAVSDSAVVTIEVVEPPEQTVFTFEPTDDVMVRITDANKNYHTRPFLRVEAGEFDGYLKFNVEGVTGTVQSAILRLYVRGGSFDGGNVFSVSNNFAGSNVEWDEETLTASNAPEIDGPAIGSFGEAPVDDSVEVDVTAAIVGNGVYSLAISKTTPDRVEYHAKESGFVPRLIIESLNGEPNSRPIAQDDSVTTVQGESVDIHVTENDMDLDGSLDLGSVAIVTPPSHGTATVDLGTALVTYAPDAYFTGPDAFIYTVNDDQGGLSNYATVSITVSADSNVTTFTFQPIEDAQVKLKDPNENYGDKIETKVDAGEFNSYFKFNVTGVSANFESVRLRLYVTNESNDGGSVYSVSNNFLGTITPWIEDTLTAQNAPEISGPVIGDIGQAPLETFVEVDVSAAVFGEGIFSFGLSKNSSDRAAFSTKEGENPPQLIVETEPPLSKRTSEREETEPDEPIETTEALPVAITLGPNYPNPFNAGTTITYSLPTSLKVELVVYNTRGQKVRTLVAGVQQPGHKKIFWDGQNDRGKDISSGVYFLYLKIGSQNFTRKMILQK